MSEIKINLPDGSSMEVPQSFTVADLANKISEGLGRVAVAAKINENIVDLKKICETENVENWSRIILPELDQKFF